jgi:GNAT superfamily N-acetyltransferase
VNAMKSDLDLIVKDDDGAIRARCSCWWSTGHTLDAGHAAGVERERIGVIGQYSAESQDAAVRVLTDACAQLEAHGCTLEIGPMDGNTWWAYRLVIERGSEPPFFLEPDTPDAWVSHFTGAGFETLATYSSALARDLSQRDPRLDALATRLAARHIVIRPLDLSRADDDLRRIYELSLDAFKDNFLYTPIDEAEFMEQNRRLLPFVRPELVLLAEHHTELIAFLFAVPDILQQKRGQTPDTIIIKTVAVRPGLAQAGLGSLLVAEVQQRAAALGYTRAVHALMHEQNVSRNISRRYAETIRRYALFAKRLASPGPSAPFTA